MKFKAGWMRFTTLARKRCLVISEPLLISISTNINSGSVPKFILGAPTPHVFSTGVDLAVLFGEIKPKGELSLLGLERHLLSYYGMSRTDQENADILTGGIFLVLILFLLSTCGACTVWAWRIALQ